MIHAIKKHFIIKNDAANFVTGTENHSKADCKSTIQENYFYILSTVE